MVALSTVTSVEAKTRDNGERKNRLIPLKQLLNAQRLHLQGKEEESLGELSMALGSEKPLTRLSSSLNKAFEQDSPLSDMLLNITLAETRKGIRK